MSNQEPERWISVKDRLPEVHELVLCSFCGIVSYGKFNGQIWVVNDEPEASLVKTDIISFVKHWMPLPAPPKADKGAEKIEAQMRYEGGVFNPTTGSYDVKPLDVTKDEGGEDV